MKFKAILLSLLIFFGYMGASLAEPTVGSLAMTEMACTTDAGMKLFEAATQGGDPVKVWNEQGQAGTCHSFPATMVSINSILSKGLDKDGDMMYVIDIGEGYVTFSWEKVGEDS